MAFEIPGFKFTGVCGAASLAAKQYYFVKQHTDGTIIVPAAITDRPLGILQNNPVVGGEAELMVDGVSKVIAGETIAINDVIGIAADGRAIPVVPGTDTTAYVLGVALSAGDAGQTVSVLFDCKSPARAA